LDSDPIGRIWNGEMLIREQKIEGINARQRSRQRPCVLMLHHWNSDIVADGRSGVWTGLPPLLITGSGCFLIRTTRMAGMEWLNGNGASVLGS